MEMNIKTHLKEGMKIKPLSVFEEGKNDVEYIIVKSDEDGELYGFFQKDIVKLSEINEAKFVCTGLDAFEEVREYLEVRINKDKTELLDHRDSTLASIEEAIDANPYSPDGEWVDVSVRKVFTTREEYLKKIHGENFLAIHLRGLIKDLYDNAEELSNGIRRVVSENKKQKRNIDV